MSKAPFKQLQIVGKRHRVVWAATLESRDGEFDPAVNEIRIASGLPFDEERDTVLHEITHAIERQMACPIPERAVRLIATGMYGVLRENPRLVDYLLEKDPDATGNDQVDR